MKNFTIYLGLNDLSRLLIAAVNQRSNSIIKSNFAPMDARISYTSRYNSTCGRLALNIPTRAFYTASEKLSNVIKSKRFAKKIYEIYRL